MDKKTLRFEYYDSKTKNFIDIKEITFTYLKNGNFPKTVHAFIVEFIEYVSKGGMAKMLVLDIDKNKFIPY